MTFIMLMCHHHVSVLGWPTIYEYGTGSTILNDAGFAVLLDRFSFQLFHIDTALLHTHFEVSLGINDRGTPGNAQEWDRAIVLPSCEINECLQPYGSPADLDPSTYCTENVRVAAGTASQDDHDVLEACRFEGVPHDVRIEPACRPEMEHHVTSRRHSLVSALSQLIPPKTLWQVETPQLRNRSLFEDFAYVLSFVLY